MLRVVKNTRAMSVRTIRPIARTSKFSRSMRAARRPTVGPKIREANAYCIRTRRVPKRADGSRAVNSFTPMARYEPEINQ